jgi:hypothetical protein
MNGLLRLIGIDLGDLKRRTYWLIGGGILAAIFGTIACGFLALAAYLALIETMLPVHAALTVAGGSMVLVLIVAAIAAIVAHRARREVNAAVRASTIAAFSPTLFRLAARHTGIAGAVAVIVATLAYMEGRKR